MVGKLSVSAFQNFFRIENPLSIKEVMSQNVWYVLFPSSTSSTYIALQPLCVFDLSSTSSTCFNIHRIWWYGWKALSLSFLHLSSTSSTYFNIHLLWLVLISSTSLTYIALQPLCVFDLSSTSSTYFNIHLLWLVLISSTSSTYIALQPLCVFDLSSTSSTLLWSFVQNAFNAMYLNTSNIKQCALTHIGTCPLMYTQQIRWQWVRMSGFLTI